MSDEVIENAHLEKLNFFKNIAQPSAEELKEIEKINVAHKCLAKGSCRNEYTRFGQSVSLPAEN